MHRCCAFPFALAGLFLFFKITRELRTDFDQGLSMAEEGSDYILVAMMQIFLFVDCGSSRILYR